MIKTISFVIPVYNSEKTISKVISEIESTMIGLEESFNYEIILVNDFSKDNSLKVCTELSEVKPFIKLLSFSKNFGQHHALMAGLRETGGEYVILLDDDMQTPPKEIVKLISAIEEGYDVVFAQYSLKKQSSLRNIGSKVNELMAKALIGKPKNIELNSFVIMRRYIVQEISKYDNPYPYLAGLIFRVTTNVGGVLVEHREREYGSSNYSLKKLISLWLNGFTNFSVKPLRISSMIGMVFSLVSFFTMLILIAKRLIDPDIQMGWTSTMVLIMFFGGIQLISLGLVGEYVGRIFLSINKTPQYVIKERHNSSLN